MSQFVQLTKDDTAYLLDLIQEMDSTTAFTERQRGYTVPKLERIQNDPRSGRLAFQDVEYLLELIEDDELPELEQQREMTRAALLEIQTLQAKRLEETKAVEEQRASRRTRRQPAASLQKHFARVS
jgi:hypothetical protein